MNRAIALVLMLGVCLGAGACEDLLPEPDFERMIEQPSLRPYEASDYLPDRRAMQAPPEGTIPRGRLLGQTGLTEGTAPGGYLEEIPLAVDRPFLERGRNRFEIFCATCHGVAGTGQSVVAQNMSLRKPRSLLDDEVVGYPPGRIFHVITLGYGLMPSYAADLPLADRWAVVGYLRALQLSRRVPLEALPPELRREAEGALR